MPPIMKIFFTSIGTIRTPYKNNAPFQPVESETEEFYVRVDPKYTQGLAELSKFRYIYIIYFLNKVTKEVRMEATPPWANGKKVGLFASRSPARPNPIGISIVKLLRIEDNILFTSGLDVLDGTPLLDIKPYIRDLDSKEDANYGWLDDLEYRDHLILHIKGIPHDY